VRKEEAAGKAGLRVGAGQGLSPVRRNVAGIDIGSRQMHVCAPVSEDGRTEVRVFATATDEIVACAKWLKQLQVESVAMESTGVYWIPVLEILESFQFETLLVDTRPLSRVPGRKTDVTDTEWIQTLHSHGLLQSCFRPTEEISQLRSLIRQKAVLVAEQADWTRRMQKCLDQMNVRVHHAVSDTQGVTGMLILRAIANGERDPRKLAEFRDEGCHKSKEQIAALLSGHWRPDHLFNLEQGLRMYDAIAERVAVYECEIQKRMKDLTPPGRADLQAPPLPNPAKRKAMKRRNQEEKRQTLYRLVGVDLTTIDGVGTETAEAVISEYGIEMDRFASEKEFVAHLKLAPRQAISGGKPLKKRGGKTKGTRAGRALRNAAVGVGKGATALGAYYRRISFNKGASVAVFATARKIATLIYRLLRWGQAYVDIGQEAYEEQYKARRLRSLTSTAAQLGYQILKKNEAVSA
jgi:transposase